MALPGEEKLTMLRLKGPPYYHFTYLPYCECGSEMKGLCVECGNAPSSPGIDYCRGCVEPDEELRKRIALEIDPDEFRNACLKKVV